MSVKKDVIIIGGGASGMFAAIKAKENNPDKTVTILEKQNRIGRKLLSTGNGRCNLTNANCSKKNYHGSFRKYLDTVYGICSQDRVLKEFNNISLFTKVETEGRVYPISNYATSVLDVLRFRLESLGVEIICDAKVIDVKTGKNFTVITDNEKYLCEKLIVCTGLCASPKLGSDTSGLNILQKLGHSTTALSPALCPIKVTDKLLPSLKGLRVSGKVSLFDNDKLVKEEYGEIHFTENSLSGICVFNLSSMIKKVKSPIISIDLLPYSDEKYVFNILQRNKDIFYDRACEDFFTGIFNKKLGIAIMKKAGITQLSRSVKSLSDNEIKRLAGAIKNWSFNAVKSNDFSKAQVASGGIVGNEIDPYSMKSLLINNLYICGEIIDVDGECGGYNLQFAFASGIIAGENV